MTNYLSQLLYTVLGGLCFGLVSTNHPAQALVFSTAKHASKVAPADSVYSAPPRHITANTWMFTPDDPEEEGSFGLELAFSGELLVVGKPQTFDQYEDVGEVVIYRSDVGGSWMLEKTLPAEIVAENGRFGSYVALSGDRLAVSDNTQGFHVHIYERNQGGSNNWGLVKTLTTGDGIREVALDVDILAVGVPVPFTQGKISIYYKNEGGANNWGKVKDITDPLPSGYDFGFSLSLSQGTVFARMRSYSLDGDFVGVFGRDYGGTDNWGLVKNIEVGDYPESYSAVPRAADGSKLVVEFGHFANVFEIYEKDLGGSNNWGLRTSFSLPPDAGAGDGHGRSFAFDGERLAVGRQEGIGAVGAVYIFAKDVDGANNWGLYTTIRPKVSDIPDSLNPFFGYGIGIAGDYLAVGAPGADSRDYEDAGVAYVFDFVSGGPLFPDIANWWVPIKRLLTPP